MSDSEAASASVSGVREWQEDDDKTQPATKRLKPARSARRSDRTAALETFHQYGGKWQLYSFHMQRKFRADDLINSRNPCLYYIEQVNSPDGSFLMCVCCQKPLYCDKSKFAQHEGTETHKRRYFEHISSLTAEKYYKGQAGLHTMNDNAVRAATIDVLDVFLRHNVRLHTIPKLLTSSTAAAVTVASKLPSSARTLARACLELKHVHLQRNNAALRMMARHKYAIVVDETPMNAYKSGSGVLAIAAVSASNKFASPLLLWCQFIQGSVNNAVVAAHISACMERYSIPKANITGIVTDNAAYMRPACERLDLTQFTCSAHALHRLVCAFIHNAPELHTCLTSINKVLHVGHGTERQRRFDASTNLGAKLRRQLHGSGTRWGTWLVAAEAVRTHIVAIKVFIEAEQVLVQRSRGADESKSLREAVQSLSSTSLLASLEVCKHVYTKVYPLFAATQKQRYSPFDLLNRLLQLQGFLFARSEKPESFDSFFAADVMKKCIAWDAGPPTALQRARIAATGSAYHVDYTRFRAKMIKIFKDMLKRFSLIKNTLCLLEAQAYLDPGNADDCQWRLPGVEVEGSVKVFNRHSGPEHINRCLNLLQQPSLQNITGREEGSISAFEEYEQFVAELNAQDAQYFEEMRAHPESEPPKRERPSFYEYWTSGEGSTRYTTLSNVALMLYSTPVSSASVESLFSVVTDSTPPKRNRLTNARFEIEMFSRCNGDLWEKAGLSGSGSKADYYATARAAGMDMAIGSNAQVEQTFSPGQFAAMNPSAETSAAVQSISAVETDEQLEFVAAYRSPEEEAVTLMLASLHDLEPLEDQLRQAQAEQNHTYIADT